MQSQIEKPIQTLVVRYVNPVHIHYIWPKVKDMLERGLDRSQHEYNIDHLKQYVIEGKNILLVSEDGEKIWGACTICFENYPNARVAFITSIGGRMIANKSIWEQFENWARGMGATIIRGYAFESVARLWKTHFGLEKTYVVVEKRI